MRPSTDTKSRHCCRRSGSLVPGCGIVRHARLAFCRTDNRKVRPPAGFPRCSFPVWHFPDAVCTDTVASPDHRGMMLRSAIATRRNERSRHQGAGHSVDTGISPEHSTIVRVDQKDRVPRSRSGRVGRRSECCDRTSGVKRTASPRSETPVNKAMYPQSDGCPPSDGCAHLLKS